MSAAKTVFMFSGQGSQYFHMGKSLFQDNAVFRTHMTQLDEVVRHLTGQSVVETLYSPANKISMPFDRTLLTHPAIIMVEYALAHTLIDAGIVPDMVLGASLGSFTAACLAGALSINDTLAMAVAHARSLEQTCRAGGMIAILATPDMFGETFLSQYSECAAVNFSSHFVVSAPDADCAMIEKELRQRDIAFQRIPVSFAFHSRWIESARSQFETQTAAIAVSKLHLPMMCCDHASLLTTLEPGHFWNVTRHPIRFSEAITRLETENGYRYIDVGPAGTLAVFLKYLLPSTTTSRVHSILTPYGQDTANLARLMPT